MNLKKNIPLFVMAAAVSVFTGCSETKKVSTPEISLLDVNSAPADVTFDWQQPYKTILSSFKNSDQYTPSSMFELRDITNDNIPELIISPSDEVSAQCQVYTMLDSAADLIATCGSYGVLQYIESQNAIGYCYNGESFTIGEYQTFNEGSFNKEFDFYNNEGSASSGALIRYEVNGDEVTLAKYEEYLHPYRDYVTAEVGRKYTFGDDAVNYAINCSESWNTVLTDTQKELFRERLNAVIAEAELMDAAFEIVDLDLNGIPEVVLSTGVLEDSQVRIFYLDEDGIKELNTSCDDDGGIHFDMTSKIFYSTNYEGNVQCWSMAGADISNLKPSDSTMCCGRKYALTAENIANVFSGEEAVSDEDAVSGEENNG